MAQCYVHGDSLESALVGIVVPEEEPFVAWCYRQGLRGSFAELCRQSAAKTALLQELLTVGKQAQLKAFEQVRHFSDHRFACALHKPNFAFFV